MEDGCVGACARSGSGRRVSAVELQLPSVSGRARRLAALPLTDAELDHTLGLLLLREAGDLEVHATTAVHETLCKGTSLLQTLGAYTRVEWRTVVTGTEVSLAGGFTLRGFPVSS